MILVWKGTAAMKASCLQYSMCYKICQQEFIESVAMVPLVKVIAQNCFFKDSFDSQPPLCPDMDTVTSPLFFIKAETLISFD